MKNKQYSAVKIYIGIREYLTSDIDKASAFCKMFDGTFSPLFDDQNPPTSQDIIRIK